MRLDQIESRLELSKIALAYIINILSKYDHAIQRESIHLYGMDIDVYVEVSDWKKLFDALLEISWYWNVNPPEISGNICYFNVSFKGELPECTTFSSITSPFETWSTST